MKNTFVGMSKPAWYIDPLDLSKSFDMHTLGFKLVHLNAS